MFHKKLVLQQVEMFENINKWHQNTKQHQVMNKTSTYEDSETSKTYFNKEW